MSDVPAEVIAQVEALNARERVRRAASAEPLPGPLAAAFAGQPLTLHGFTVRPATAGDIILLKRLDSPLIRRTKEIVEHLRRIEAGEIERNTPLPPSNYDDEEACEMIYQFTTPLPEVRARLNAGRDAFRETALRAVADGAAYAHLAEVMAAVEASYEASFRTVLTHQVRDDDPGEQRNFSTPPPATASAGGSTTRAA